MLLAAAILASPAQAAAIAWHNNVAEAARQSAAQHKPMLVMVKARWCGPCHTMLSQTLSNPTLAARVNQQFVPVLLDADENAAIVQSLSVEAMPTILVISPEQKIIGRFTGFQSATQLNELLAPFAAHEFRQIARWSIRQPEAP